MSDIMRPIPFRDLLDWVLTEYKKNRSIFGVRKVVQRDEEKRFPIFGQTIETVYGPAAGPNTQLAQNLIAAYAGGSSWFELKTVQKMDGRELAKCVPKPCIEMRDEGYNCEWSTELTVEEALHEYIKAWFIIHIIAKEFDLGDPDGIVFNMSVGYDLDGIRQPKVNHFIDTMIDASKDEVFQDCVETSLEAVRSKKLHHVTIRDIRRIPSRISDSVTESTLHGCPPAEIEAIASYMLKTKKLNTFVKCNPTLLGYEYARRTLDGLGFDYIAFDDHHFTTDLQWKDAVPMLERLQGEADELGLSFGVKLTNTFPVDVKAHELPSEEMYMSGRALFPLTIELVRRLSEKFNGKLRISYCGGADYFNIHDLVSAGVWPVTVASTILKPGGYERLSQFYEVLSDIPGKAFTKVDVSAVTKLEKRALESGRYSKPVKPLPSMKVEESLPLMNCFLAPCTTSCPIHQDIPAYLQAMEEGRPYDAFRIIVEKNALPFITGTLCPHTCADRCMRNHYEEGLHIREVKLQAAESAYDTYMSEPKRPAPKASGKKVAVIGAGPAGLASAFFLSRAGVETVVFEKRPEAGGIVKYAIPHFRIEDRKIENDVKLCQRFGARIITGREITDLEQLKKDGFTDFVLATGAWKGSAPVLKEGKSMDAIDFLTAVKYGQDSLNLGKDVVVIGGGNTAMDVARAAVRQRGVHTVRLVYRRTKRYMPADEEELRMALEDGVIFEELLAPVSLKDGTLVCSVMKLGEPDESGRRRPVDTGEKKLLPADTVITAVGERIDAALYENLSVKLDEKGRPVVDEQLQTSRPHIYAVGDGRRGPATVVKAIADAALCAQAIAGAHFDRYEEENAAGDEAALLRKKGQLTAELSQQPDPRCLGCATVCEVCTDVCPNRANIAIKVPGLRMGQILHMDGMCNECGNCAVFCPYSGRPYKDKLTLFWSKEDMDSSENQGFLVLKGTNVRLRFAGTVQEVDVAEKSDLYEPLRKFILGVIQHHSYLFAPGAGEHAES